MTITLSPEAWNDRFQPEQIDPAQHPDPDDALDVLSRDSSMLESGYWRSIQLRQGLAVSIGDFRYSDRIIISHPEAESSWLEYHFHVSGEHQSEQFAIGAGQFALIGSGYCPKQTSNFFETQPYLEVIIEVKPEMLCSFAGDAAGELPIALQPLIRPSDQVQYCRAGTATLAMQTAARRILQCPYRGIAKRLYLEGKALELLALVLVQEIEIWEGTPTFQTLKPVLKPDAIDRVHHARDILLQRLDNPPSLMELARQVGLNECTLKQGFRHVFGTTAFGYLHDYAMQQAQQLLETGDLKVEEVAKLVGYQNRSAFAVAFRRKFGVNPSEYRRMSKTDAMRTHKG